MGSPSDRKTTTHVLLEQIGGQAAIAEECEITDSAVSQWATEDRIPRPREKYLRLAHPGKHWAEYDAARSRPAKRRHARRAAAAPHASASAERPTAPALETKGRA